MRKKNREINIFSMSALDLFASALGAFILITIILFPYYLKVDRKVLAELKTCETSLTSMTAENTDLTTKLDDCEKEKGEISEELKKCKEEGRLNTGHLGECRENLEECTRGASECAKELKKIFFILVMTWDTYDDVDLHVVDPRGKEYYYKARTHPGSSYELSVDTIENKSANNGKGGGVEIWEAPNAKIGTYKVYYKYYTDRAPANPAVKGKLYFRNEIIKFKTKTLTNKGSKTLIATIVINDEGEVEVTQH